MGANRSPQFAMSGSLARNSGFTLVELLAATALLSMFMVAAASVTGSLGRTRESMLRDAARAPYFQSPMQTIERDLVNARAYKLNGQTLTLLGYGLLDAENLSVLHLPSEVTYTVRSAGGRRWLIRTQKSADPLGAQHRLTQPMLGGVRDVVFDFEQAAAPASSAQQDEIPEPPETPETPETIKETDATERATDELAPQVEEGLSIDPLLTRRGFTVIPKHVDLMVRYEERGRADARHSFYPR